MTTEHHHPPMGSWTAQALKEFVVVTANLHYGGLDLDTGDDTDLRTTLTALIELEPTVVALQEVDARHVRHMWAAAHRIANTLGMSLVLGPSAAMGVEVGNHTAVLVRTSTGVQIVDQWPAAGKAGGRRPWCMAALRIPGLERLLHVYSVHLPARTAVGQLENAQAIGSWVSEHDQDAIVAGDFNNYPRRGPQPTHDELTRVNRHLHQSRTIRLPDGTLTANHAVDDALTRDAELVDVTAELVARDGEPHRLKATGRGGARLDRCYAHRRWAAAARSWRQVPIGSDHDAVAVTFDPTAVKA